MYGPIITLLITPREAGSDPNWAENKSEWCFARNPPSVSQNVDGRRISAAEEAEAKRDTAMDLVCHENFSMAPSHKHHSKLYHGHRPHHTTPAHDEYMSSNSSSSSSDSLSPPPSLSQYSTSSTMSSGIGSSTCQSPPTSSGGPFSSLVVGAEDSNFGDLSTVTPMKSTCSSVESGAIMSSSSSTASFANFRESVVQLVHNQPAAEPPHQHRSQSGATKRAPAQVIHYNYSPKIRKAEQDPVFLRDLCLANLFESELHHRTDGPIMGETNAQMRRIVAGWMMEVSNSSHIAGLLTVL